MSGFGFGLGLGLGAWRRVSVRAAITMRVDVASSEACEARGARSMRTAPRSRCVAERGG